MVNTQVELDLGFGWTKGACGHKVFRQPSVVGVKKPLFEEQKKKGDLILEEYFVGDLAVRHSDVRYQSIKDNKAEIWTTKVLLQAALACLAPRDVINVVSGLPVDYYFQQKQTMQELLLSVNEQKEYTLEVTGKDVVSAKPQVQHVKIVPQPLGSAMDFLLDHAGNIIRMAEAKRTILVVDIGYFTLDLLVLDAMEIHKKSCSPAGLGVDTAYRILQQYLREKIGKSPARFELDRVVETGEFDGYNVKPLIDRAFKDLAAQIQGEIESLNMNFHTIILTGGAATLVAPGLFFSQMHTLHEPQLGNVRGYGKIGRRLWGIR